MKRIEQISPILLVIILVGAALGFTQSTTEGSTSAESNRPLSQVVIPPIPNQVLFAGDTVSLDRYDMRERYDREQTTFCYMHSTTLLTFRRANRYFPQIAPILKSNGVPDDFKYLAAIESTLSPRAYSPARAAGLWQMLASTAKMYGLEVTSFVDERYHTQKATEAACKYLKEAYAKYGHWPTVAASYNGGMGRISTELARQQAETAFDLLLVEETSRYMFRLLALKQVMESPTTYGFYLEDSQLYPRIACREVVVDYTIPDLAKFAKEQGTNYYQLKEFNPWLRDRQLPKKAGKSYVIEIPIAESMNYSTTQQKTYDSRWTAKESEVKL